MSRRNKKGAYRQLLISKRKYVIVTREGQPPPLYSALVHSLVLVIQLGQDIKRIRDITKFRYYRSVDIVFYLWIARGMAFKKN